MTITRRHRIPQNIENAILALSAEQPNLGRGRVAAALMLRGFDATPATVRSVWQRHGLQNAAKRIAAFAAPAEEIIVTSAADDTVIIPAPHEIPPSARPSLGLAADALVFSVAVLSALDHHGADTLDQPNPHDLPSIEHTALFAEDPVGPVHIPVETAADIFHQAQPHFDFS
jgi:hypothetical protein